MFRILELLDLYQGNIPLSKFLKNYFNAHPEMGSRDRRLYRDACFGYFRVSNAFKSHDTRTKIAIGLFLGNIETSPEFLSLLGPPWPTVFFKHHDESFLEKISTLENLKYNIDFKKAFEPEWLSPGLPEPDAFFLNFLQTQNVFIRIKSQKIDVVLEEARTKVQDEAMIQFLGKNVIGFDAGEKLTDWESYQNGWFEIQDISSQQAGSLIKPGKNESWWDACGGAGGKTLQVLDTIKPGKWYVSDIRESVLKNLSIRSKRAGLFPDQLFKADLEGKFQPPFHPESLDGILVDVPCTGSGTWARTPESVHFFKKSAIEDFQQKQRNIVKNVIPYLKKGGRLVYMTCSVFNAENETQAEYFSSHFFLHLKSKKFIQESGSRGDTMFVAEFEKL